MVSYSWLLQPTSPTADPPYQPSDITRSTSDVITTSLLTLLLCVWTTLHSNIPLSTRRKESAALWRDKLSYAVLAFLTPETVLAIAFRQLWEARLVCRMLEEIERGVNSAGGVGDEELGLGVGIPGAHGVNNQTATAEEEKPRSAQIPPSAQTPPVTGWRKTWKWLFPDNLEIGFFLIMGGVEVLRMQDPTQRRQLTPQGVVHLAAHAGLLPPLSADEINDKSKSDGLAKLVASVQASWFVVQCIARTIYHYPLSLLEVHVHAHVFFALGMYLLWLKKPQNVLVTTIVLLDEPSILLLVNNPNDFARGESRYLIRRDPDKIITDETDQGSLVDPQEESRIFNFSRGELIKVLFNILVCAVYGAVHSIPWDSHFPTHLERIMWRVSVVMLLVSPTFALLIRIVNELVQDVSEGYVGVRGLRGVVEELRRTGWRKWWVVWPLQVCLLVMRGLLVVMDKANFVARIFFWVESFACMRSLEVGTWRNVGWLGVLPHL